MFYLNNADAGYPEFDHAREAVAASTAIGGEVLISSAGFSEEKLAELEAALQAELQ